MALSIGQTLAVSFADVVNEARKPADQWSENAALAELEKQGFIKREDMGPTIEATLDYKANPGARVQATDMDPVSGTKTEVITAASYTPAEIAVPITWSKKDEVMNSTPNQKVALVKSLALNGLSSHDDLIEQSFFAASGTTNGLLGFLTHMTTAGTGSDGGIDSSLEIWWKNQQSTYADDTDIEATFTTVYNNCSKGSGSKLQPTAMISDAATQAIFEGTQQAQQRWMSGDELKAGFKVLSFKNARYIFSQYASTSVFFINPKNLNLIVSKSYFRDKGETQEFPLQNAYISKIYSALQLITNNRSRLGIAHL